MFSKNNINNSEKLTRHKRGIKNFCTMVIALSITLSMLPAAYATNAFSSVVSTLTTYVKLGGGLITVWGAVILGSNIKDHNGPGITNGVWTMVGGAVIVAAAALFSAG